MIRINRIDEHQRTRSIRLSEKNDILFYPLPPLFHERWTLTMQIKTTCPKSWLFSANIHNVGKMRFLSLNIASVRGHGDKRNPWTNIYAKQNYVGLLLLLAFIFLINLCIMPLTANSPNNYLLDKIKISLRSG